MDCLVLPIQNKLEEWKKITHALDKEHAKGKPLAYYLGNDRVCNFLRVWRRHPIILWRMPKVSRSNVGVLFR